MADGAAILRTESLSKDFSGLKALSGVDLEVRVGSIHGLIGPNGSGKTTFFNVITGLLPVTEGRIFFDGREVTATVPDQRTRLGISRTFQIPKVLPEMTCLENVMLGSHPRTRADVLGTLLRAPFTASVQELKIRERARELLSFVGLEGSAQRLAGDLAWVEEQLLQLARALAAEPRLLLLDEPTAGMGPDESAEVKAVVNHIRDLGTTIVLVAHDINLIMDLSERVTVLNFGRKIAEGTAVEIQNHPDVLEAYLGRE